MGVSTSTPCHECMIQFTVRLNLFLKVSYDAIPPCNINGLSQKLEKNEFIPFTNLYMPFQTGLSCEAFVQSLKNADFISNGIQTFNIQHGTHPLQSVR